MVVQFKDPALIKPQSFSNGIAPLDGGIERIDGRLVAMNKPAIDVDHQIAISFLELLQHQNGEELIRKAGTQEMEIQSPRPAVFPPFLINVSITPFTLRCGHGTLSPCRMRADRAGATTVTVSRAGFDRKGFLILSWFSG